jgi:hypothetical protein
MKRQTCLLLNPIYNGVCGPAALVLDGFSVSKELQSGIATDLVLFSQFGLFSGINLSN